MTTMTFAPAAVNEAIETLPELDEPTYEPTPEESAWWAAECDDRDDRELAEWLMELEQRAEEALTLDRMCDVPTGSLVGHDGYSF